MFMHSQSSLVKLALLLLTAPVGLFLPSVQAAEIAYRHVPRSCPQTQLFRTIVDSGKVSSMGISPDGLIFADGNEDGTIKIWNLKTSRLLHDFQGHSTKVLSITISLDNQTLISDGSDRIIKVWNLKTGKLTRSF